ncbi:carbon-nitrogen hydrolase family protein [Corynebacterium sp. TAE3-ERU12]|uniref:carbon-nitrogen hydrolase family protein n=1 Tax=Corynebacterium sp. TAE3-ERU12 TaxID=2849491 RepID=UPI001C4493BD|nr:carbon-nitrogen hydrolase family protein [Corynebacterium sp. TAE3-ERU12]MBV7296008.1 carbon-nitrogen hydrolase family protein [Corynebacterium sp. TAE3-ERU12]
MRISLAQLENQPVKQDNLDAIRAAIIRAGRDEADLVVFPEAAMQAFNSGRLDAPAEPLDGPFAQAIREATREAGITAVVGMFRPADTKEVDGDTLNRVYNTLLVTGPGVEGHYDKKWLFDAFGFRESDTVAPGDKPLLLKIPTGSGSVQREVTVGFATCFDLRFPSLFTELADAGAEVIVVPASWGEGPGKLHQWRILTTARALDTTCFLVAVDAARPGGPSEVGEQSGPTGIGHSAVYGPDGQIVAEAGNGPQQFSVDIDLDELPRVRETIPVIELRT